MSNWSVVCLHLCTLLCGTRVVFGQWCANASDDVNTGGSCTFQRDWCGWRSTGSYYSNWTWKYYVHDRSEYFVVWNSWNSAVDLASPLLCPTGADHHTLRFKYLIQDNYRCQLSVYLKDANSYKKQQIWNTTRTNGLSLNYISTPLEIPSQDNIFQIIFEGKKLSDAPRLSYCNVIILDDIQYKRIPQPSATTKSFTPHPSLLTEVSTHKQQTTVTVHLISEQTIDQGSSQSVLSQTTMEESGGGLGVGAAVGIIVGVISVVVIIGVIVVFLRRQHNGSKDCSSVLNHFKNGATPEQKVIQEVTKVADSNVDFPVSNGSKMETTLHSGHGIPAYELAATLQSTEDSPYKVSAGPTGAIYSKVIKAKTNASGPVQHTEDDYNKLSHEPPRVKPVGQHTNHAYDHQDDDMKTAPGQVTSMNEYSLARVNNENSVLPIVIIMDDHETNSHTIVPTKQDGKQSYVNVNPGLKTQQQTTEAEYNRLDPGHPQQAQAADLSKTGDYGVYSHLHGEDGEYHQLDFDHDRPHVRAHEDNTDRQDIYYHLQADAYNI